MQKWRSLVSDKGIAAILPHLFAVEDPRLNQYLAAIYERGFSLRSMAEVCHVSHETVRARITRAAEEQASGDIKDLSGLPSVTSLPVKRRAGATYFLSDKIKDTLRNLNDEAKSYRHGKDDTVVRAFNMLVLELTAQGIPMTAIADAVGQSPRQLRRRLARWDVYPEKSRSRTYARFTEVEPASLQPASVGAPSATCKYPDCPSHSGGSCWH
jgi:lambda repressor-like predicted transcriptional regulator